PRGRGLVSRCAAHRRVPGRRRNLLDESWLIAVTGRPSPFRCEGPYAVGALTTDGEPVYFVTPFVTQPLPGALARFRGVFVQRYGSTNQSQSQPPSLVLVGAFAP